MATATQSFFCTATEYKPFRTVTVASFFSNGNSSLFARQHKPFSHSNAKSYVARRSKKFYRDKLSLAKRLKLDIDSGIRLADVVDRSVARINNYNVLDTEKIDVSNITPAQAAELIKTRL